MKAELCIKTVKNAVISYPELKGAILHSDRGSQYTSKKYREALKSARLVQSMNSEWGRCHDNARCESMWARMKEELFYSRNRKPDNYTVAELKTMIWRYYMSYWNNRRICSANGGLPSAVKRRRYYEELRSAAWFSKNVLSFIDNIKIISQVETHANKSLQPNIRKKRSTKGCCSLWDFVFYAHI